MDRFKSRIHQEELRAGLSCCGTWNVHPAAVKTCHTLEEQYYVYKESEQREQTETHENAERSRVSAVYVDAAAACASFPAHKELPLELNTLVCPSC